MPDAHGQPHVLIICGQPLPLGGVPATGVGLRAWAVGRGLRMNGVDVTYAIPDDILPETFSSSLDSELVPFAYHDLDRCVERIRPTVVLLIGWPWANVMTPRPDVFMVIDLTGPYVLENVYSQYQEQATMPWLKIQALQKADFLLCGGDIQRNYFLTWMLLAGYDLKEAPIAVVHMGLDPLLPEPRTPSEPTFIHGGLFLPWQDPSVMLRQLVSRLERRGKGRLVIIGGTHPSYPFPTGATEALVKELGQSARVEIVSLIPYETYVERYLTASVSVDLMQRNVERELAVPHRTIVALWCALPVIYNDYSELSTYIRDYQAGWALSPDKRDDLDRVIDIVLDRPELVETFRGNAQRLVREQFTWDKTVQPLVNYCRKPFRRRRQASLLDQSINPLDDRVGRAMLQVKHSSVYQSLKTIKKRLSSR